MATANHSDLWVQPSGDRWSQPSPSEQRFFAQHDSEFPRHSWTTETETELELESDPYAAPASPQRATAARVAGAVGVVAVLALAVAAFAPRLPLVASQVALFANHLELPGDPRLAPGPEPLPLDRDSALGSSPVEYAPSEPTPTEATPVLEAPVTEAPVTSKAVEEPVASEPVESAPEPVVVHEPALTPEEITLREERYEQWLKSEGLQRIQ